VLENLLYYFNLCSKLLKIDMKLL